MFTGIVQGTTEVARVDSMGAARAVTVAFDAAAVEGLQVGASVAIDGVCLTVVAITNERVRFDVIQETLERTTLGQLKVGDRVNYERAAKLGDEIGGHLLSGHVMETAQVVRVEQRPGDVALEMSVTQHLLRYILPKGFVSIDGVSLTVGPVDPEASTFGVFLIPETLRATTLSRRTVGSQVNVEVDAMTQAVVDTAERVLAQRFPHEA